MKRKTRPIYPCIVSTLEHMVLRACYLPEVIKLMLSTFFLQTVMYQHVSLIIDLKKYKDDILCFSKHSLSVPSTMVFFEGENSNVVRRQGKRYFWTKQLVSFFP